MPDGMDARGITKARNLLNELMARFHRGIGARIERINTLADNSTNGLQQSFGLMVSYHYDPVAIEPNLE